MTNTTYKRGGKAEIKWTGGTQGRSVSVTVYHWFNAQHNNGIQKCLVQYSGTMSGNKGTIEGLVPGQRYWIVLTDSANSGNTAWVDFQAPKGARPNASFKLAAFNSNYNKNNDYVVLSPEFTISGLSGKKTFNYVFVLAMPNGDLLRTDDMKWELGNGYYYFGDDGFRFYWNDIVRTYGSIPSGSYMFQLIVDDYIVGSKTLSIR